MTEERIAKIEGIISQMNERLNHLSNDISDLRNEMKNDISDLRNEMKNEIKELRNEIKSNFKWLIGILLVILIPMWVSIITTIIRITR